MDTVLLKYYQDSYLHKNTIGLQDLYDYNHAL